MPTLPTCDNAFRAGVVALERHLGGLLTADPRAVHQARVASRRLREIVPGLPIRRKKAAHLSRRLRRVTRRLGVVRELDVLVPLCEELASAGRVDERGLKALTATLKDERDEARALLSAGRTPGRVRRLADDLTELSTSLTARAASRRDAGGPVALPWRRDLLVRVQRKARRLAEAMERAGTVYVPERLHQVRIAAKKLRYALELTAPAVGAGRPRSLELALLVRAQDALGRLHDLQVLASRARSLQASFEPRHATACRGLQRLMDQLDGDCRRLHGRYLRLGPELATLASSLTATSERHGRRRKA